MPNAKDWTIYEIELSDKNFKTLHKKDFPQKYENRNFLNSAELPSHFLLFSFYLKLWSFYIKYNF